jgi:hypothetical protein
MKRLVAVGISIGVLAGLFTWFSFGVLTEIGGWKTPLVVWVGFAAWACFYAIGGGTKGLITSMGSVSSGVVWGFLIVLVWKDVAVSSMALLGLCVGLGAFLMCVQASVSILSFIPGAFIGASSFFGFGGASGFAQMGYIFASVLVSVILGSILAFLSERGADVIEKGFGLAPGDPAELGGAHAHAAQ